jgi:uncharacterized protein
MVTAPLVRGGARPDVWSGPVIDCDVHVNVPALDRLLPYLEPVWVQFIRERGWVGPGRLANTYPPNMPSTCRPEWRPPDGRVPASELSLLREHILDPGQVERAIVNCYYALDSLRHPDWAAALVSALNDWLIAEWLDKDPRLSASLIVPARYPQDMVKEIERVGDHPGFVQVFMPVRSDRLYGNRIWHPVYEAMTRHNLVMGLHWGGTSEAAPGPAGWPTWYIEEYAAEVQAYAAQVTSMVAEGVFQLYPELRVSILEIGFAWLPVWMWRMDKEWKGLRREIPWVSEPPSDIIRRHMHLSTAPLDAGSHEDLTEVVEWLGSEEMLMFATDYPHFHDDDVSALLRATPESMHAKLMAENARSWYRM